MTNDSVATSAAPCAKSSANVGDRQTDKRTDRHPYRLKLSCHYVRHFHFISFMFW